MAGGADLTGVDFGLQGLLFLGSGLGASFADDFSDDEEDDEGQQEGEDDDASDDGEADPIKAELFEGDGRESSGFDVGAKLALEGDREGARVSFFDAREFGFNDELSKDLAPGIFDAADDVIGGHGFAVGGSRLAAEALEEGDEILDDGFVHDDEDVDICVACLVIEAHDVVAHHRGDEVLRVKAVGDEDDDALGLVAFVVGEFADGAFDAAIEKGAPALRARFADGSRGGVCRAKGGDINALAVVDEGGDAIGVAGLPHDCGEALLHELQLILGEAVRDGEDYGDVEGFVGVGKGVDDGFGRQLLAVTSDVGGFELVW